MFRTALLIAMLSPQAASQSGGTVIFAADQIAEMLDQCSRPVPRPGEGGWTPGAADIAKFEAKLPAAIAPKRATAGEELRGAPRGWIRQYVGIVRGGKRFVYGNFVPGSFDRTSGWREMPIQVCDGGPAFFGAEYDVEKDAISHLAFNGMA